MYSRIVSYPKNRSFFLFGPRATGKSWWVRSEFKDALYVDLLESELFTRLLASPQRLESMIPPGHAGWIVIDEIQKVPALLDEVHRLIEKRRFRFVLTGSSARKLRRGGLNLLAGRAITLRMHPLTVQELGRDFQLGFSLKFGHLPSVYGEADPKSYLASYVTTYLKEEIQQEGLTRNLGAFSRFLEAASFSQGSVLNMSAVARECSVSRKAVEDYFSILEDLLLASKLPVFTRRAQRKTILHPKFYFFDTGVYRVIRPLGPLDSPDEIDGAALETLFLQELRALNDYLSMGYKIFYWKTPAGIEVDFVLYGERGLKAFEIKRSATLRVQDFSGLRQFLADYPAARAYLFYGGTRHYFDSSVEVVPIGEGLKRLPDLLK
jgi:uncharacterized protein